MRSRAWWLIGLIACPTSVVANDKADRVFVNGQVWTGNSAKPRAEALAVRGPRILAVGTTKEIRRRAEKHTDVIDLRGAFVAPGFIDAHQHFLSGSLPKDMPRTERVARIRQGLEAAAARGVTSLHDALAEEEDLALLDRLEREGVLTLRVHAALEMLKAPTPDQLAAQAAVRARYQTTRLRVGAVRALVDGRIEDQAAWVFEPYEGGGNGRPTWTAEELEASVLAYDREGWQVQIHVSGDRGIAVALDAYGKAAQTNGKRERRHRLERVELPRPSDLSRMKLLDVVASTQPLFVFPGNEARQGGLEPARAALVNAFRQIDDAGVVQAFGSGWPVRSSDILLAISAAVTRKRPDQIGAQAAAGISAEMALRHFTRDAAYAVREEGVKGKLEPGYLGDFTVLSQDILAIPPADIPKTRVLRTVVAGNDTFVAR